MKITDTDPGFKRTIRALGRMGGVTLGVQGDEATASAPGAGITIGELAAIHELGLGVPERSFLRSWLDENQDQMLADARAMMQRMVKGQVTRERALELLGVRWQSAIQRRILQGGITPELSEQTKKRKGSSTPLLDTGQLVSAITYVVEDSVGRL